MIDKVYWVMNNALDVIVTERDEKKARQQATQHAIDQCEPAAVMLRVPVASFPELRAIAVFEEETGRCTWETDVYDAELVG